MHSLRLGIVAATGVLLAGFAQNTAAIEPQEAEAPARPNILLVLIDTLRADHLGYHGYERETSPAIDAFARENLVFSRAVAPAPWTPPSVASMFTGVYPTVHGVHTHLYEEEKTRDEPVMGEVLADGFTTLAEALQGHGYRTEAVVTNPWVTDYLGFAQGFDSYKQVHYMSAANVNRVVSRLIKKGGSAAAPFFLYVHYFEPHVPYEPPAPFAGRFTGEVEGTSLPPDKADWINLYDAEIATVDHSFGRLIDELKRSGLYEDLVVALVGDHGEQFYERGEHGHGYRLHAEETHVPFILRAAGKRGTEKAMVSLVDVYPTLLSLAGVEAPSNQGISLVDDLRRRNFRGVFSEMTRWRNEKSYAVGGNKLVLEFDAADTATVSRDREKSARLYDIERDATEVTPLNDRKLLEEMREALYALYRDSLFRREGVESKSKPLSPETIEKLRSLGYIE